jgi:hypothetical protein
MRFQGFFFFLLQFALAAMDNFRIWPFEITFGKVDGGKPHDGPHKQNKEAKTAQFREVLSVRRRQHFFRRINFKIWKGSVKKS